VTSPNQRSLALGGSVRSVHVNRGANMILRPSRGLGRVEPNTGPRVVCSAYFLCGKGGQTLGTVVSKHVRSSLTKEGSGGHTSPDIEGGEKHYENFTCIEACIAILTYYMYVHCSMKAEH
jgi:hypothetical protein